MESVALLKQEHQNILHMLQVIKQASLQVMQGEAVCVQDWRDMIQFIRVYADAIHHGKEEQFLFAQMTENLGEIADNLIRHGMLVEHDLGRLYVLDLAQALDAYELQDTPENRLAILVAAGSYANLLKRHIDKEDSVVFAYGENNLPKEAAAKVEQNVADFEKDNKNAAARDKQLLSLERLARKYAE